MALQIGLFAPAARTLVDDARGRIVYYPQLLEAPLEARLFARLRDEVDWNAERRPMYDRVVDVPRLTGRLDIARSREDPDLGPLIERVEATAGARFNSIGLNLYRDEGDSVAWHNDHENELAPPPVIALVSLGATREMRLRTKERPRRTLRLDLEPGSLLVMSGETQHFWEHHVPKERRRVEARISVALRQRRAGFVPGAAEGAGYEL